MKSPFALLTSLALLSACGQTGPLYMPKVPAPGAPPASTTPPPTPAPVIQTVTPPAPAAGVTMPAGGSNANNIDATTNQSAPTPQR